MTREEILEGNKLIAEFMGFSNVEVFNNSLLLSHPIEGIWYYDPLWYLDYHKDWSILMPVVDKINNVWFNLSRTRQKQIEITFRAIQNRILLVNLSESHRLVIKFIKWHKI